MHLTSTPKWAVPVWGTSQSAGVWFREAPSFHSFTKLPPPLAGMKAILPHTGVYEAGGAPPLQRRLFIFDCSNCPHVKAVEENALPKFPSENEKTGNNARLNTHFGNRTEGEGDGRRRERQSLTGTLMASYKTCLLVTHFSPCLPASPSGCFTPAVQHQNNKGCCREGTHDSRDGGMGDRERGKEAGSSWVHFLLLLF